MIYNHSAPLNSRRAESVLKHSFGTRQLVVIDVSSHRHLKTPCERFEDSFYLMMLVLTLGLDVEIHLCGIAEALKEM